MEHLQGFAELPTEKQLNKATRLYFTKCWQGVLFENGKMNYRAFNFVKNQIFNCFSQQELYVFYKFLLQLEPTKMMIQECLKEALKFVEQEKTAYEKNKLKELSIQKQKDYGDLLCL